VEGKRRRVRGGERRGGEYRKIEEGRGGQRRAEAGRGE
jgi:hypothetical protein